MKIAIAVLVVLLAFGGFVAMQADTYHVERSASIGALPPVVFAQLDDFKAWGEWSPWDKIDPDMKREYGGPERAVGATYGWQGNSDVGKGKMTIVELERPTHIAYRLEFIEPFASIAKSTITVEQRHGRRSVGMDVDRDYMRSCSACHGHDAMIAKTREGLGQSRRSHRRRRADPRAPTRSCKQQLDAEQNPPSRRQRASDRPSSNGSAQVRRCEGTDSS